MMTFHHPPYTSYFYSDCSVAAHVVVTSPEPDSNLSLIGPRLIVAFPAGNSGICAFFEPQNGVNGTLGIKLLNSSMGSPLSAVYLPPVGSIPSVGIKGVIQFNSSAMLSLPILGSIRAIRDFVEGPSLLYKAFQDSIHIGVLDIDGMALVRTWIDDVTTMTLAFKPLYGRVSVQGQQLMFEEGEYIFSAHFNYPQLRQLSAEEVINDEHQYLLETQHDDLSSLSFLSYSDKLLAGSWRFLTYFGRDDMITTLLLEPILNKQVVLDVIGSVLERINGSDGSACHEETIGEYAIYLNRKAKHPEDYLYDYNMVDTHFFLPILMEQYFIESRGTEEELRDLLLKSSGHINHANKGLTWGELFIRLISKIMRETTAFASPGGQTVHNLIRLRDGIPMGQWRDSVEGLGGARIPFDINVALVPAALHSIAHLCRVFAEIVCGEHAQDWSDLASQRAHIWEDHTLPLFEIKLSATEARQRLSNFIQMSANTYYHGPSQAETIGTEDVTFYAVGLEGGTGLTQIPVMNSDTSLRLFLLNDKHDNKLTNFINNTAISVLRSFPAGLMTPVGMLVANPAYSGLDYVIQNFSTSAYHGSVIWSWQLVTMVRGLERQLDRCQNMDFSPQFCRDDVVYENVRKAYNMMWDSIENNRDLLSHEVWS